MGDTGSLFLGFLLANIAILTCQKSTTATALGIPILALGVPISDTAIAFTRRVLGGRSPFVADRRHLHHVLHAIGVKPRRAVIIIHLGTGLLCASALCAILFGPRYLYAGVASLAAGLAWLYWLHQRHGARARGGAAAEVPAGDSPTDARPAAAGDLLKAANLPD
jgi:UDP-GlcNAc:undecaprenyl-phosphate GlcNAc-1-phosphate transferase